MTDRGEVRATGRPRDVLVAVRPPGVGAGRRMRTSSVIRALARHADVDVLFGAHDPPPPGHELAPVPGVRLHAMRPTSRVLRTPRAALDVLGGGCVSWARGADPAFARQLAPLLPGARRVIADGPVPMLALRGLARRRPVVLLAQNVESELRPGARIERTERRLVRAAAEVWMCTAHDVAAVARLGAPQPPPALLVRNVVDVAGTPTRAGRRGSGRVLFVADLTYEPNRDALRHLADAVLPALRRRRPDAEVLVAGGGPSPVEARPGLRLLGFVDDLEARYAEADAVVVPVLHGSGSPLKLVEALAHGMPTVATPHAAALVPEAAPGADLLVGEDAEAMAAHLARALDGDAEAVGRGARAVAERHYSIEGLAEVLRADVAGPVPGGGGSA